MTTFVSQADWNFFLPPINLKLPFLNLYAVFSATPLHCKSIHQYDPTIHVHRYLYALGS